MTEQSIKKYLISPFKTYVCSLYTISLIPSFILITNCQAQIPPFRKPQKPFEIPQPLQPQESPIYIEPRTPQSLPQEQFSKLRVSKFAFVGNNAISSNILLKIVEPYLNQELSLSELINIATK